MRGKDLVRMAGALLLGAAIAFPAGILFGGGWGSGQVEVARTPEPADRRKVFSPKILSDPYFLDQQRRNVEALEAACRETGQSCQEARQARRWLEKLPPNG